jgi:hypothetical protein
MLVLIWGVHQANYFCDRDWTTQISLIRFNKIAILAQAMRRDFCFDRNEATLTIGLILRDGQTSL